MRFQTVFGPAETILRDSAYFMTAYQIGLEIQRHFPVVWQDLMSEYGSNVGSGAGQPYSWATQISRALDYCLQNNIIAGLQNEEITTEGIKVEGIEPGNKVVAIWKVD